MMAHLWVHQVDFMLIYTWSLIDMAWPTGRRLTAEVKKKISESNRRRIALVAEALAARAEKARVEAAQRLADLKAELARAEREAERGAKFAADDVVERGAA